LNARLKDAEINWNEYLISRQDVYLKSYQESRALADSMYQVLSASIRDNPSEKKKA
jgi:CHASE3 domain sensor protein